MMGPLFVSSTQPEKYRQGDEPSEVVYLNRQNRQVKRWFFGVKMKKNIHKLPQDGVIITKAPGLLSEGFR
jgi:hypothetical protein